MSNSLLKPNLAIKQDYFSKQLNFVKSKKKKKSLCDTLAIPSSPKDERQNRRLSREKK